jgi:hypothetical protein
MQPAVNRERLWNAFMEIGRIGETKAGGCHRLALSDEDCRTRHLFIEWAKEAVFRMQRRAAKESLTGHGKDDLSCRLHVGDAIRRRP